MKLYLNTIESTEQTSNSVVTTESGLCFSVEFYLNRKILERFFWPLHYMDVGDFRDPEYRFMVDIIRERVGRKSCRHGTCSYTSSEKEYDSEPTEPTFGIHDVWIESFLDNIDSDIIEPTYADVVRRGIEYTPSNCITQAVIVPDNMPIVYECKEYNDRLSCNFCVQYCMHIYDKIDRVLSRDARFMNRMYRAWNRGDSWYILFVLLEETVSYQSVRDFIHIHSLCGFLDLLKVLCIILLGEHLGSLFVILFLAPIIEEPFKNTSVRTYVLVYYETLAYVTAGIPVYDRIAPALMHIFFTGYGVFSL